MAELEQSIEGYNGEVKWAVSKSDGAPRKLMDISQLNRVGWKAITSFSDDMAEAYASGSMVGVVDF